MKQVMFAHQTDNVLRRFLKILFDEGLTEKIHFYVNKVQSRQRGRCLEPGNLLLWVRVSPALTAIHASCA